MAGRPVAVRGGGLGGAQIGLIVFAFVSVAALGGFIFQLTKVKEADQRAAQAERELSKYGRPPAPLGSYYENEASARSTTVFNVMAADVSKLSTLIAGEEGLVATALETRANELLRQIHASKPAVNESDTLFTAIRTLDAGLTEATSTVGDQARELRETEQEIAALTQQLSAARELFEQQVADTKADYERVRTDFTSKLGEKDAQLGELQGTLGERDKELQTVKREIEKDRRETRLVLTRKDGQIARLQEQVQGLKQGFDSEGILKKADGRILRAIPGSEVVYINLGANDNIKVGMGFEVYSQTGTVGQVLRGKASLEAVTLMEGTAECRVTRTTAGQPIVEGDIVVNIAYEQNRRPKFVVRGEFDLDFDGLIDMDGVGEITSIIHRWGGQVVPELDETVDYVVIGLAPEAPRVSPQASDVVRDQEERRLLQRSRFKQIITEAGQMYVPVITQNQFLFLTGFYGDMTIRNR